MGAAARGRSELHERRIRIGWIACVIIVQMLIQVWSLTGDRLDVTRSLPLHFCDVAPWIGIAALLTRNRTMCAITYYWSFGLSIWAYIMPVLTAGPETLAFWAHWVGHTQTIATGAYIVVVDRYRPSVRSMLIAAAVTVVYSLAMVPVNLALDADYTYVGRDSPASPLGPWPWRIAVLLICEVAMFALLTLPWIAIQRKTTAQT